MKKLLLVLPMLFIGFSYHAQVCTIDYSNTSPGIYPDTLPPATAGEFYDEDITFVLPTDTLGFDFTNFEIIDVALPAGMDWECSNEANGCNYDPQADPYGCARAFGTPTIPGEYTIEISVIADLTIQSGNASSFFVFLEVLPPVQENEGFSMAPGFGCDNITVEFTNNIPSENYTPIPDITEGYVYSWDFGNGNQSNQETPSPQTYTGPGEYYIDYICVLDTFGFFLSEITLNSIGCSDGIGLGNADVYVEVFDGNNQIVYSSNPNDADLPITVTMNVELTTPPYSVKVWDDDSDNLLGVGSDADNCIDGEEGTTTGVAIEIPDIDEYGNTSNFGTSGSLNLSYVINKPIITIEVSDTVTVFEGPEAPVATIDEDFGFATVSTDDLGYEYQWFLDGEPIPGADSTSLEVTETGDYTVVATNENGCSAESEPLSYTSTVNVSEVTPSIFKLYPNPATETVNIELTSSKNITSVSLIDVMGRVIIQKTGSFEDGIQLDVSNQQPGYFIIQLSDGTTTWKEKLLIQ